MDTILITTHLPSSPFPRPTRLPLLPHLPTSLSLSPRRSTMGTSISPLRSLPNPNGPHFNGWDDLDLPEAHAKPDAARRFLTSLGVRDQKDAFLILLGFVSALAVSRVRFPLVAVVPVSVFAFAAGLSFRNLEDGGDRAGTESLAGSLKFLDLKLDELRSVAEAGDAQRCAQTVEAVRSAAVPLREAAGRPKRKDVGFGGLEFDFDFSRILGSLERLVFPKSTKARDVAARDVPEELEKGTSGCSDRAGGGSGESLLSSETRNRLDGADRGGHLSGGVLLEGSRGRSKVEGGTRVTRPAMDEKNVPLYSHESCVDSALPFEEELEDQDGMMRFVNRKRSFEKNVLEQESYRKENVGGLSGDSKLSGMNERKTGLLSEFGTELCEETTVKMRNKRFSQSSGKGSERSMDETWDQIGDFCEENHRVGGDMVGDQQPSASPVSSDEEFDQKVKEAANLLKQAKELLRNEDDEESVEIRLYKSASLLSTAVALKPRSLLAVGQLGNTFLLHGELKLKISRDLRSLLSKSDPLFVRKGRRMQLKGLSKQSLSKERAASILIDVCEECEGLLVNAGKTYKMALSIDESDVRAIYNWGLALTFRAQLIGDIGPEAALDADKVYLAAIDKFSALTSRSHSIAPGALFRWGVALQQRSQLRPPDSREKMKLLKQAKSLFEDILRSDADNPAVREALFSCISELNFYRQL